jgi:N-acetylglucosaminyldiphosphoundecaprenol N-acetyl-beta-D-mannosaminyltransferase
VADVTLQMATAQIVQWAHDREAAIVFLANAHMVVEATHDCILRDGFNRALALPDGLPLLWILKLKGFWKAKQIRGADLLRAVCSVAIDENIPLGFYGGDAATMDRMLARLMGAGRRPAVAIAPPFISKHSYVDLSRDLQAIRDAGVRILFVALGCPKQEHWMLQNAQALGCVVIGVGAAFDFAASTKREAPQALQRLGLEWAFRLCSEPRRLGWRYLRTNPKFIVLALCDIVASALFSRALRIR